jgi:quinoprotein glucose dehydrogenase
MLYVPSVSLPFTIGMTKKPVPHADYAGGILPLPTVQGLPIFKPPYGRITAIDLNTGDHRWQVPLGDLTVPALKALKLPPLGRPARGHVLLTKTLLIAGQEGTTQRVSGADRGFALVADFESIDPKLTAFDKATGRVVGEVPLPRNVTGAPMTYMLNGRQYLVVATGGSNLPAELIALRLP